MKKLIFTMVVSAVLVACGGGEKTETTESKPISNATQEEAAPKAEAPVVAKKDGKALIEASDCRTCHKDDQKLIGPAYKEVAKKYESNSENISKLADKVMKGGQGVWGEIPMAGHPNLSKEDAEAMVQYILTIK
jgi:cytochrome c